MSVIKFEITDDHLKLLSFLELHYMDGNLITINDDINSPFGVGDKYEDMGLILFGKPEGDFDPHDYEPILYDKEQMEYMENLLKELPQVIQIVARLKTFESGLYKRKFNDYVWKKIG